MYLASIEEARRRLGEILDLARYTGVFTTITRRDKPAAVIVSTTWAGLPNRMAAELMPMAECTTHPVLAGEDPANCRSCSIRRVCLDYLTAGGTISHPGAMLAARDVHVGKIPRGQLMRLPRMDGEPASGEAGVEGKIADAAVLSQRIDAAFPVTPLGSKTINCLMTGRRITTIGELATFTAGELLTVDQFGPKCLELVNSVLAERGLSLNEGRVNLEHPLNGHEGRV